MQERIADLGDVSQIMNVIRDAQEFLKEQGVDQWQDGFPDEATIKDDIKYLQSYVFVEEDEIIGFMAINFGEEPSYQTIYDGAFQCNTKQYATIHRTAINKKYRGKGLSIRMFFLAEQLANKHEMDSIRMDTHRNNQLMQHLAVKYGYEYCGVIKLERSNMERIVYEKVLY